MYYAIMDLTKVTSSCCIDDSRNEECLTYHFAVIVINNNLDIVTNISTNICEKEIHDFIKGFISITTEHINPLCGVFFGQKIKKMMKSYINMDKLTPKERAFIYDSINIRNGFSKILKKDKLNFIDFFKWHEISLLYNGNNAYENVLAIVKVLRKYNNVDDILQTMIMDEKKYQLRKVKSKSKNKN